MTSTDSNDLQKRAFEIACQAIDLDTNQQQQFVTKACGRNADLLEMTRTLLESAAEAHHFLDAPILHPAASEPQIENFEILRTVASGGMGVVYEARQIRPSRIVALKVLRPGLLQTPALKRFQREGRFLAMLRHPGIARIYNIGSFISNDGEEPFLTMEYLRGAPLSDFLQEHAMPVERALSLTMQICDAVHHAHECGILHRDIKPSNVIVNDDDTVKIIDFGVARFFKHDQPVDVDGDVSSTITAITGEQSSVIGTVAYMSPEQLTGDHSNLRPTCDVYSIGMMLYEMLAGRTPFDLYDITLPEVAIVTRQTTPPPVSHIKSALRGDLDLICSRALEKSPNHRYQTAAALAADIRRYVHQQPIAPRRTGRLARVMLSLRQRFSAARRYHNSVVL